MAIWIFSSIIFVNETVASGLKQDFYYDVQWGNITVGKAFINLILEEKKITLKIKTKTEGFVNIFYDYKGELTSNSIKKENIWQANSFLSNGITNDKKRFTSVNWSQNSKSMDYKIDPVLDLKKVHHVLKTSLIDVIDPITAIIKVIDKIKKKTTCDIKLKIFDGRRRYDLLTKELGKTFLEKDRPNSYNGNVIICGIKVIPIGGHRLKSKWKPDEDKFSDFQVFFGRTVSGVMFPVRMNLNRWFGTITVRLIQSNI